MNLSKNSTYTLNNGIEIPIIGLGTWKITDPTEVQTAIHAALEAGYRHIDTAAAYKNEEAVGQALKTSGIPREEIFLTTKLGSQGHGYEEAKAALASSLQLLRVDYVDLYLVHWPAPLAIRDQWREKNQEMWRYLEEAYEAGLIKAIGVSNFHPHHLESLFETAKIKPAVNQIYLSPSDAQPKLVAYNNAHDILNEAYSPLGSGTLLAAAALEKIGQKYNKSTAQVALRWSLQKGFLPIPKSTSPERIKANIDIFDFVLTAEEMAIIDDLKGIAGTAADPDNVSF